ncbi:hypothetical protein BCR42DRAFT_425139 [Absidia repens]|uniref:Uncharacterized protein n=1 Tax=Absidia repens TaxID=90262 RepID=A0A1X2I3P0_9FUNG|nr:hypothetical protein BCR42DRAFT_425139 [Absidia repens]
MTTTTNTKNEQSTNIIRPSQSTTTALEQSSLNNMDFIQPSSLPSPPVSTVEPKLWLLRPPPFPPPVSSSSSSFSIPCVEQQVALTEPTTDTQNPILFHDLEQFVVNTTRNEEALLTGASTTSNTLPRSAAALQIPNAPSVHLGDDDFAFETDDFILLEDDDSGLTPPHILFPPL